MWVGPLAAQFRILCSPAWLLYMSADTYDHTCVYVILYIFIIGTDETDLTASPKNKVLHSALASGLSSSTVAGS